MKTAQKITSLLLALTFLVSSFGFTIGKMVCLKSGKTKYSLSVIEDCCAKKKKEAQDCCDESEKQVEAEYSFASPECCEINNTFLSLDDFRGPTKSEISQPFALQTLFINPVLVFNSDKVVSDKLTISFADLPPPRSGRLLLSFISILII